MKSDRIQSVDQFRGFAIISMILVNFLAYYPEAPKFLRHANGYGYTFADVVAPLFLFAVGLVSQGAVSRAVRRSGFLLGYLKIIRRNILLIAIGVVGGIATHLQFVFTWGILQAIGMAGLISLPFSSAKPGVKLILCAAVCATYAVFSKELQAFIGQGKHGGVQGAVMWALIILIAEAASEKFLLKDPRRLVGNLSVWSGVLIAIAFAFSISTPFSKSGLTPSYILLGCGLSCVVFAGFVLLNDIRGWIIPFLSEMGRNALLLFLLHYGLGVVFFRTLPADSAWSMALGCCLIALVCSGLAVFLNRREIYLKL